MTWFNRLGATARYILTARFTIVVLAVAAFGLWLVTVPGPMKFAGGSAVAARRLSRCKSYRRSG